MKTGILIDYMKAQRTFLFIAIFSLAGITMAWSQPNRGFNFQAVARDADGNLIKNADITVVAGIRSSSPDGELIWQETQTVTTGDLGLFSLVLCEDPGLKSGGTLEIPADIPWSAMDHFLQLSIDAGNGMINLESQPLRPVPYSLALTGKAPSFRSLSVGGEKVLPESDALFMVRRPDGYPVFAVYDTVVWVYTDQVGTKGVKGGFAVGGYRNTSKGEAHDYMVVRSDSIILRVDEEAAGKGVKGGFAVGGYRNTAKGNAFNFLNLTPENYFIGEDAGSNTTIGLYNSFLGFQAGISNKEGSENIFIGYQAGYNHTGIHPDSIVPGGPIGNGNCYIGPSAGYSSRTSAFNTMIGYKAGFKNTASYNTFIGASAGLNNTTGFNNIFMGENSGVINDKGANNIFIGTHAGFSNIDGSNNVTIGTGAGSAIKNGSENVIIGSASGGGSFYGGDGTGSNNVIIGFEAGYETLDGSNNIFIGHGAGKKERGSNLLYISNSDVEQPLIWGSFESKNLVINGNGADNIYKNTFYVNGVAGGVVAWTTESDARLKKDVEPITGALGKVMALQGVNFTWDDPDREEMGRQMGFIAQQAAPIVPEVVQTGGSMYTMQYAPLTALLVEAMKEQQQIIREKETELELLKQRVEKLEQILSMEE